MPSAPRERVQQHEDQFSSDKLVYRRPFFDVTDSEIDCLKRSGQLRGHLETESHSISALVTPCRVGP